MVFVGDDDGRLQVAELFRLRQRRVVLAQVDDVVLDAFGTGGPAYSNGLNRDSVYSSCDPNSTRKRIRQRDAACPPVLNLAASR